jgi:hypothetical protein
MSFSPFGGCAGDPHGARSRVAAMITRSGKHRKTEMRLKVKASRRTQSTWEPQLQLRQL